MAAIVGGVAHVRVLHALPGMPSLDVYIDGRLAAQDVTFARLSAYVALEPGSHHLGFLPAGAAEAGELLHADLEEARPDDDYTVVALGTAQHPHALLLHDRTTRPGPGNAKVRALHASPDTTPIDIDFAGGAELFRHLAFRHVTPFVQVTAGSGDLEVRLSDQMDIIAALPNQALAEGGICTLVALGLLSAQPAFTIVPFMETAPALV